MAQARPRPVVVVRLRGRTDTVGATLVEVLSDYAERLKAVNRHLYLSGLGSAIHDQIRRSHKPRLSGPVRACDVTAIRGEATQEALADAQTWLVALQQNAHHDTDHGAARGRSPRGW